MEHFPLHPPSPCTYRVPTHILLFPARFQGKLGNPIDCLVYVKHVELDDCPYLLAMYSYLPESFDLEAEFRKVASQVRNGGVTEATPNQTRVSSVSSVLKFSL